MAYVNLNTLDILEKKSPLKESDGEYFECDEEMAVGSDAGFDRYFASLARLLHLDLLRDILHQLLSVADDSDQLIASGERAQDFHRAFDGFSVQRAEAFIDKERIHLNAAEIR